MEERVKTEEAVQAPKGMTVTQASARFLMCMLVGWLFMYAVPMKWFLTYFLPMSFFLLFGLVTFGVCGLGWPFAAPGGFLWKPGMSRAIPGLAMSALWIAVAVGLAWVEVNVWPRIPLFPAGLWFGIGVFMVTLWYTFDGVGPFPFTKPWANFLFASVSILGLAGLLFEVFVNFSGTPLEAAPSNPRGLFPAPWWFGLCVWIIVWIQVFGSPMCLQGWPFYKLPKPLYQISLALVVSLASCGGPADPGDVLLRRRQEGLGGRPRRRDPPYGRWRRHVGAATRGPQGQ